MTSPRNWPRQLAAGSAAITLNLLEQALLSDAWRGIIIKEVTRHILTRKNTFLNRRRPCQVQQDKQDMMQALLYSFQRALERGQISRGVLHSLLRSAFANYIDEMQDEESKNAATSFAAKHGGQQPPGLMVISPTRTCNLRCTGCYASAGPSGERMDWDVFNRIITEAKKLWGMRFFVISGGEPFTYRSHGKGLLDMVKKHHECLFLSYTNGTLIDGRLAGRIAEAGNLTPAISVEGFEKSTDKRRGAGVFRSILAVGLVSGGLSGLAGMVMVTGTFHLLAQNFDYTTGYTAIGVATLGAFHPIGTLVASFLYSVLMVGENSLQQQPANPVPIQLTYVLEVTIVLCVLVVQHRLSGRRRG